MQQLWMCGTCHSLNQPAARNCYRCRADRATQEYIDPRGSPDAPGMAAVPARDPSLFGALVFGLVGAVLATWLWYQWDVLFAGSGGVFGRGFVFSGAWVGFGIGLGAILGGRGRTSFAIVMLSVGLTLLALVVGEYLLVSRFIGRQFNAPSNAVLMLNADAVASALPGYVAQSPLRPLMWIFALAVAFLEPWYRLVGRTTERD